MQRLFLIGNLIFLLAFSGLAQAQVPTRYVTDDFEVMLRTGPSTQNKIIRPLRSGALIKVLRENAGNGHSQVQTSQGEIGYMLKRFITQNSSARDELIRLRQQLAQVRLNPNELSSKLVNAQDENKILIEQNMQLSGQLAEANNRINNVEAASGDILSVSDRNQSLEDEVQQLLLQLDDIRIQNQALKDKANYVHNLSFAGVLILGLFLGWLLSRSGGRRTKPW